MIQTTSKEPYVISTELYEPSTCIHCGISEAEIDGVYCKECMYG